MSTHLDALERVITDVVAPAATTTDELGLFPRPAIAALGDAGILGLTVSPHVGADLALKLCGGAAFRKETGIERHFRDSLAARVMAPTTDALLDFVGRAIAGLPLLGPPGGSGVSPGEAA